ncbi:hypothetical protein LI177_13550 [bacterium 210820-DFI.6.37]|nr:hypothetical protein [bacterium 210820-DFI.6.37]
MKDIIIVCAGCYGMEVYSVISEINRIAMKKGENPPYNILGFIDDNSCDLMLEYGIKEKVIGSIHGWNPIGNEVYAIGAAKPQLKETLTNLLKKNGCKFETIIAPWSIVSPNCIIGEGCFITAYTISSGVKLGNFVNINGSMICSGAQIDDYSTTTGFAVIEDAHICKKVFVGSHAVIKSGVVVGADANISVGSMIISDVKPGTLMFGVPAAEIG